ncbi:TipAS antibiotic-recognition domain-containing protein [Okibacterium endophyticum]
MEWSIQQIARLAGTTSRTLRHYGAVGLLEPTRIGQNGYRYYNEEALVRLQRILLLRDLGLGLPEIADVLAKPDEPTRALRGHLQWLQQEQDRLTLQIASVEDTITRLEGGEQLMAENMFDGFDHTQYREEVEERWGKDAYAKGDAWWRSLSAAEKAEFQKRASALASDWADAAARGVAADSDEAQRLAERQLEWLTSAYQGQAPTKEHFVGLGEMYVADERFGANYGGAKGAEFVRDAMRVYAERNL